MTSLRLALLTALAACTHPPEQPSAPPANQATAPQPAKVLQWTTTIGSHFDDVVRHRLAFAHLDHVRVVTRVIDGGRGALEVTLDQPTLDQIAQVHQLVERPIAAHFAHGSDSFALTPDTLGQIDLQFDAATSLPTLLIALAPAARESFAAFVATAGEVDLVMDGTPMLEHITPAGPIRDGKLQITLGGADVAANEATRAELFDYLSAAASAPPVALR